MYVYLFLVVCIGFVVVGGGGGGVCSVGTGFVDWLEEGFLYEKSVDMCICFWQSLIVLRWPVWLTGCWYPITVWTKWKKKHLEVQNHCCPCSLKETVFLRLNFLCAWNRLKTTTWSTINILQLILYQFYKITFLYTTINTCFMNSLPC